ncbi:DUF6233 domain-containing protein [Streptomyces sp. IBSNAI002]|uniref:DUF6233 domain-containing protein n=1 Tax=Streptomyces sp. IBSNAI002 TaxID=3457500 RepID=UPI003FCF96A8
MTRPKPGGRGLVVHDHDCPRGESGGREPGVEDSLDALKRPGIEACTSCDAAADLVPALKLGTGSGRGRSRSAEERLAPLQRGHRQRSLRKSLGGSGLQAGQ